MARQFFIFVVFASAMQNSLATEGSTSTRIQTEMMSDYSTIEALRKVAHLRYQAAVDIIFNYLTDSAYMTCGNQNPSEDSSVTTNSSKPEVLAAFITQFDVTLLAIQIIYPEVYVNLSIAQRTGFAHIQTYVDDIYTGLELIESTNYTGNLIQIEALENKTLTASPVLNTIIYDLIRNGKSNPPKIEAAIASAQRKSYVQYIASDRSIYAGIKALLTAIASGSRAQCGTVFSAIESARSEASLALEAEVDVKFGLISNFLTSIFIMQSGIVINLSAIQAINMASTSNCENEINRTSSVGQDCSTEGTLENENGMMADFFAIEDLERVALDSVETLTTLIFDSLEVARSNVARGTECSSEDYHSMIAIARAKEDVAAMAAVDSYFNATVIAQPEASSVVIRVRQAAYTAAIAVNKDIAAGIELIYQQNPSGISARIEAIEYRMVTEAITVVETVFIPILKAQRSQAQTGTAIAHARDETISLIEQVFSTVSTGIKIVLAEAFPEYRCDDEDCTLSLEAVRNKTSSLFAAVPRSVFSAIEILFMASSNNQIGMEEESCA